MAIKKISTEFQLLDKFLDTSGDAGSANQVLVSTATGINWVDGSGSGIIGGPYLPLAGGTVTGTSIFTGSVGIGIATPTSKLHKNQYVSNPDLDLPQSFAVEIDSNHSGSAATTGDREQGGL
jgi:hypothetical protein